MKSKIGITNVNNIDNKNKKVKDYSKVIEETHSSDENVLLENIETHIQRTDAIRNASPTADLIIRGKEKFRILHMLNGSSLKLARFDETDKYYF